MMENRRDTEMVNLTLLTNGDWDSPTLVPFR